MRKEEPNLGMKKGLGTVYECVSRVGEMDLFLAEYIR